MLEVDNLIDLKYKNLKSIIDYMRFNEYGIKKLIARDLNLSFATVSNMTNLLLENGLFQETEANSSHFVGRSPKYLTLNPGRYSIISIDLHLEWQMAFYRIDLSRKILCSRTYKTGQHENITTFMQSVKNAFDDFIDYYKIDMESIIGAGIVMRGILDEQREYIIGSADRIFLNQPVRKMLQELIGKLVVVENDTNLAAFYSAISSGTKNLIYVYLDEGLGFGAITGGNILRGALGYSSEIDHIPMGKLKKRCPYCGNYDCLSTDLSRNGFLTKFYDNNFDYKKVYSDDWNNYVEMIKSRNEKAVEVAKENAQILGKALAAAVYITWPAKVVIGGIPLELFKIMSPIMEGQINSRKPFDPFIKVVYDDQCFETIAKGAAEMLYFNWMPDFV